MNSVEQEAAKRMAAETKETAYAAIEQEEDPRMKAALIYEAMLTAKLTINQSRKLWGLEPIGHPKANVYFTRVE